MRTFSCRCGNRLYFHNTLCTACGSEVGWCDVCQNLGAIDQSKDGKITHVDCGTDVKACPNHENDICNCYYDAASTDELCRSCVTTTVIPDLVDLNNVARWRLLERAKRRLLYELDSLSLPFDARGGAEHPVQFEFKADTEGEHVITGHADGVVTINTDEADPVHRETLRNQFGEPQRTLIGHLRHEIGHYYWFTHVEPKRLDAAIAIFGDPNAVPYSDAMPAYYQNGPLANWPESFISSYASSHPWEDFAETFAFYLDMRAVLATLAHHIPRFVPRGKRDVAALLAAYAEFGLTANEVNRTMGLTDLVPEIFPPTIIPKLEFVHGLMGEKA